MFKIGDVVKSKSNSFGTVYEIISDVDSYDKVNIRVIHCEIVPGNIGKEYCNIATSLLFPFSKAEKLISKRAKEADDI